MISTVKAIALFAIIASATGAAAFGPTDGSMMSSPRTSSSPGMMMNADQMTAICEQMMKDMRSDPVLMKHMNAIMQKRMVKSGMVNGHVPGAR